MYTVSHFKYPPFPPPEDPAPTNTASHSAQGCQNRLNHPTQALAAVPGVKKAKVNLMRGEAEVIVDDSVKDEDLLKAVVNAGYAATDISLHPKNN